MFGGALEVWGADSLMHALQRRVNAGPGGLIPFVRVQRPCLIVMVKNFGEFFYIFNH